MPAFHFQLEPVLEMRRNAERQRQLALAKIQIQRVELDQRIARVQQGVVTQRTDLRELLGAPVDGTATTAVDLGLVRLQAATSLHAVLQLRRLAIEAAGVYQRTEAARAELLKATVARKAVEHLRTKALARWRDQLRRKEAAELDDLALMRTVAATSHDPGPISSNAAAGLDARMILSMEHP